MNIFSRTFPNQLRLQVVHIPGSTSVTTMILAKAGSRHEHIKNSGISHFLEHMFFKGAAKYKTPKEVSQAVDRFGGHFNAFTGKEYAGYYVKCGAPFLDRSLDVLSDMLLHSTFPEVELEKERGVIIEEMAMYKDAPMYQIGWEFEKLLFGDQPLGRDQIGSKKNVRAFSRDDLKRYKETYYQPSNMVITLAGNVGEDTLDLVQSYFGAFPDKAAPTWAPFELKTNQSRLSAIAKKTEQYHLSLGFLGIAENDPRYEAFRVLRVILGGNMSSRMFQHIREEKGLCYSIRTQAQSFTDTGHLTTQAGVKLSDLEPALRGIAQEYRLMAQKGITLQELEDAQNYLLGSLDLNLEDSEYVAHDFADELLLSDRVNDYDAWRTKLKSVTKEGVDALAAELFDLNKAHLAVIGPKISEERLRKAIS
ncbi:MAG TPA: pitrilysin family protein [Candidatus Gracilibacteria bacterium]